MTCWLSLYLFYLACHGSIRKVNTAAQSGRQQLCSSPVSLCCRQSKQPPLPASSQRLLLLRDLDFIAAQQTGRREGVMSREGHQRCPPTPPGGWRRSGDTVGRAPGSEYICSHGLHLTLSVDVSVFLNAKPLDSSIYHTVPCNVRTVLIGLHVVDPATIQTVFWGILLPLRAVCLFSL